jgi:hypothetical protein
MPTDIPREAQVLAKIARYLQTIPEVWFYKTHGGPFGKAGIPDIIGCYWGIFFAIEVKRPGGKATPLQLATHAAIRNTNGHVIVAEDVETVREFLHRIIEEAS